MPRVLFSGTKIEITKGLNLYIGDYLEAYEIQTTPLQLEVIPKFPGHFGG
jgi:hypothetical protein